MYITFPTNSDIEHKTEYLFQTLRQAKVIVLDVDDTLYHAQTGVHDAIKQLICDDANQNPDLTVLKRQWIKDGMIEEGMPIMPAHLGALFPLIVNFYRQQGMAQLTNYLGRVYNVDYSSIPRQPELVRAIAELRAEGKKVVLYTNGPWGIFGDTKMHVNKVLDALGFAQSAFREEDIVDLIKTDRNPELLARFGVALENAADAFRKPTIQGFLNACSMWGIEAEEGQHKHVIYLDDGIKNLQPVAKKLGVTGLLMGMDEKPLFEFAKSNDVSGITAKFWTDHTDPHGYVYSIAGAVLACIVDTQPMPVFATRARERLVGLMHHRALTAEVLTNRVG